MRRNHKKRNTRKSHSSLVEIDITEVTRSGSGFGRDQNGRAIFVPFTAPGDKVKVRLIKEKNKYAEGEIVELLEKSDIRIEPKCKVFAQCGGCQWQHLPYEYQWEIKSKGVKESLRLAKVDFRHSIEEYPVENVWGYRNRIQLRGRGSELGYYARQSHELVAIQRCEVTHAELNNALPAVREEGSTKPGEYKVELNLTLDHQVKYSWNQAHGADGFRQVNDEQNTKLRDWIKERIPNDTSVLDLYGGAGNLSLPILDKVKAVHCVDLTVPDDNLTAQQFYYYRSAVLPWLQKREGEIKRNEVSITNHSWFAIIDPPRNGLADDAAEIIRCLDEHCVDKVILVGCKSDPWARDVSSFLERGWKLKEVALFDFFPHTFHVESVALLFRSKIR